MSSWKDAFRVGDAVEVNAVFASGTRWVDAKVVRKTLSGNPVVKLDLDVSKREVVVSRRFEIRSRRLCAGSVRETQGREPS